MALATKQRAVIISVLWLAWLVRGAGGFFGAQTLILTGRLSVRVMVMVFESYKTPPIYEIVGTGVRWRVPQVAPSTVSRGASKSVVVADTSSVAGATTVQVENVFLLVKNGAPGPPPRAAAGGRRGRG